jgi:hypothetical protein
LTDSGAVEYRARRSEPELIYPELMILS